MQIGCCAPINYLDKIKKLGFDFVECSSMDLPSEKNRFVTHVNKFIPSDKSIYSDDDFKLILDYTSNVVNIASALEIKSITLGSGASRRILKTNLSDIEKSYWEQLLIHLDKIAIKQSTLILLEPLTRLETNFINTIEDAVDWIEKLALKSFGVTIDSYHYFKEHSSLNDAYLNQKYIKHAHLADLNQNVPQNINNDIQEYIKFIKNIGCDLSIEMVPFNIRQLDSDLLTQIKNV